MQQVPMRRGSTLAAALLALMLPALAAAPFLAPDPAFAAGKGTDKTTKQVEASMRRILRADYEADQTTLHREFDALAAFVQSPGVGAEARYWRGFARWRQAINGWNDGMTPDEINGHTRAAVEEFTAAVAIDAAFADARAAMAICTGQLAFSVKNLEAAELERLKNTSMTEMQRAMKDEPENPRTLWLVGGTYVWTPPEQGGSVDKAIEIYNRGLAAVRKEKAAGRPPLRPVWGEPEILMSLAYANTKKPVPDLDAAARYASEALAIVPYWHYVRDILTKQIADARDKLPTAPAATTTPMN